MWISFIAYHRIDVARYSCKKLLGSFFRADVFLGIEKYLKQPVFFSSVSGRPDYVRLDENCSRHIPGLKIYWHKMQSAWFFRMKHIGCSLSWLLRSLLLRPAGWRVSELIFLASKMACILNTISRLEQTTRGNVLVQKAVFHDPNFGGDAVLCAFFKKIGVPTYSLQHSYNFDFLLFKPEEIIKYDTDFADHYLCWSENQKRLFQQRFKVAGDNILVAGNPNLIDHVLPPIRQSFKRCLVLLSRFYYHYENLQMLDELSKVPGISFVVRPHPSLKEIPERIDFDLYRQKCKGYGFELSENPMLFKDAVEEHGIDFGVCLNTAAYFDCYAYGLVCFRYTLNENEYLEGLDDRFSDAASLVAQIKKCASEAQDVLYGKVQKMLEAEIGLNRFDYRNIL